MKTEVYEYVINFRRCPICEKNTYITSFSAKTEKLVVSTLITFLRSHLKNCNKKKSDRIEFQFDLIKRQRNITNDLITYENKEVKRKLII